MKLEQRHIIASPNSSTVNADGLAQLREVALSKYRTRCFWNVNIPEGPEGIPIIIDRLKAHGDMAAWRLAASIQKASNASR